MSYFKFNQLHLRTHSVHATTGAVIRPFSISIGIFCEYARHIREVHLFGDPSEVGIGKAGDCQEEFGKIMRSEERRVGKEC